MNKVIKDEVYKCSKCGLCKSVCPIYIATKNEMFLPRGRFILLNNFFNNGKKFSKQFIRNLDICLNCNLCKDFCPSGIDSVSVYSSLKKRSIFFELKINLFFMCSSLFNFKKKIYPSKSEFTEKILYFEGCFNKYIDPSDRNASIEIIQKLGFKVEKIISQCCGYKYLSSANMKKFKENATNIIEKCNGDFSYIICSCDSCFETLSKFQNSDFTSKLITLDKFLELNHIKFDMISDSK